jgi:hypothetical protein
MSKLEDGSGGAIHCRRSLRDSFPVREVKAFVIGDDEIRRALTVYFVDVLRNKLYHFRSLRYT